MTTSTDLTPEEKKALTRYRARAKKAGITIETRNELDASGDRLEIQRYRQYRKAKAEGKL